MAEVLGVRSFADLRQWLTGLPDQIAGDPCAICQTGEQYVEFFQYAMARPDDTDAIEAHVASQMMQRLREYLDGKSGRIYWRIPFETEVKDSYVVIRFDDNGPDVDFVTNQRCVMDRKWKRIAAYCRVFRATHKTMLPAEQSRAV